MEDIDMLRRLGHVLVDPERAMLDLVAEAVALRELVERRSTLPPPGAGPVTAGESVLDSGLAISPVQAALCARQYFRTVAFVKGLHAAIGTVLRTHPQGARAVRGAADLMRCWRCRRWPCTASGCASR